MAGYTPYPAMQPIPAAAGIGLRTPHMSQVLAERPPIPWLEVHSENFFHPGSAAFADLMRIREDYPLSLHGVGLSLGSVDPLDREHLAKLKALVDAVEPGLVSEHLCWGSIDGRHVNDLLPLPYTDEALHHVAVRIEEVQDFLGREILIENVSSYFEYRCSEMPEAEFLTRVARRSGCLLLLDVNNIYVSAMNNGGDVFDYIETIPQSLVAEIHLAGHSRNRYGDRDVLVDTHNAPVCEPVWQAYAHAIGRFAMVPTLIEWDADLPTLDTLLGEAARADRYLEHDNACAA